MSTALSPLSPSYGVSSEFQLAQVFALLLVKSLSESDSEPTLFKYRRVGEDPVDETTNLPETTIEAKDVISIDDLRNMHYSDQPADWNEYVISFYVCALF